MGYEITGEALAQGTEKQREAWAVYRQHGGSMKLAAEALGVTSRAVRDRLDGLAGKSKAVPLLAVEGNPHRIIKGTSSLLDAQGNVKLQWVKTQRQETAVLEEFATALAEICESVEGKGGTTKAPKVSAPDLMCVIPLGDPHIGLLSWGAETGADWDLTIARQVFEAAIDRAVAMAPPADRCLLINLGDYFHANDQTNRTPGHGHQLDVDSRHHRVLGVGLQLQVYMVKKCLEKFKTVHVDNVKGNHDPESGLVLPYYVSAWFRDEPRVTVEMNPGLYHFHEFGDNLIGTHHGNKTLNPDALHKIMSTRQAEAWGRTKARNRRWYVGHIHNDRSVFTGGCTVETHCTLAAPDAFAAGGGWDSDRNIKVDVIHKKHGLINRHISGIEQIMGDA